MTNEIEITKFFAVPAQDLFKYFIEPVLLEKWSYPENMILRVPRFEPREGGKYRYEHTSERGTYICEGHIVQFVPNELMIMVDDWIEDPAGKRMEENLSCEIALIPLGDGCEVVIKQSGFEDSDFAEECERSWKQCLDHLQALTQRYKIQSETVNNRADSNSQM